MITYLVRFFNPLMKMGTMSRFSKYVQHFKFIKLQFTIFFKSNVLECNKKLYLKNVFKLLKKYKKYLRLKLFEKNYSKGQSNLI